MKNVIALIILLTLLPVAYSHASKETNEHSGMMNPIQSTDASINTGKAIYDQRCAGCHGANGNGALKDMPDLTDHHMMEEMSEGDIFHKITEGVPGTSMPPWEDALIEEERWHLVNYINTFHHEEEGAQNNMPHMDAPMAEAAKPPTYAAAPQKGICGPTALLLIGVLPLLIARRRVFG